MALKSLFYSLSDRTQSRLCILNILGFRLHLLDKFPLVQNSKFKILIESAFDYKKYRLIRSLRKISVFFTH
jgi:hypothetical protein